MSESSAVGAAALLAARGTEEQRRCALLAFGLPEDAPDAAATLSENGRIFPETVARFGTAEDLRRRLDCGGTTAEEARSLLEQEELWYDADERRAAMLPVLFSRFPALLGERVDGGTGAGGGLPGAAGDAWP